MAHPLRSAALTVALAAALLAGFGAAGEAVAPVTALAELRARQFEARAPRLEAATFGNSHSRAIDFGALGLDGFHRWLGGSDVFETARFVEATLPRTPALRVAFVTVPPFALDNTSVDEADPERSALRYSVYRELDDFRPISGDWATAFRAAMLPVARPDHGEGIVRTLLGRPERVWLDENGRPIHPDERPQNVGRERDAATEQARLEQEAFPFRLEPVAEAARPDLCDGVARAFERITEATAAAGVRLVLYRPPYRARYRALVEARPPDACDTAGIAEALAAGAAHVEFVDAWGMTALSERPELYHDASHLNRDGARLFSAALRAELDARGAGL